MTDISRRIDQFRTTITSIHNHSLYPSKTRLISPQKWRNLMFKSLESISEFDYADKDLIHDLRVIIRRIGQDKFIQAILSFQPFKPKFREVKLLDLDLSSSKMVSTATNEESLNKTPKTKLKIDQSIIEKGSFLNSSIKKQPKTCQSIKQIQFLQEQNVLKEFLEVIIQEQSLKKQFQKKYHPFKKILDSFIFILENKYKNIIDQASQISLQQIQKLISNDILVLQKLFLKISQPYQSIFSSQNPDELKCFRKKMNEFVKDYIKNNHRINGVVRKIMRQYSRKSPTILKIQRSINDFVEINDFNIHDDFKIEGCYIQSMNSLMQFAQSLTAKQSLERLKELRSAVLRDVDDYYELIGQSKERQINAEILIEIVRFVMCKLKGWIPQIFAQLKFLQIVYGDEQIAFMYDGASYIYAQLITLFDAMEMETSQKEKEGV